LGTTIEPGRSGNAASAATSRWHLERAGLTRTAIRRQLLAGCVRRTATSSSRARSFASTATESSRSNTTSSAGPASALAILRSLLAGTDRQERRRAKQSVADSKRVGGPVTVASSARSRVGDDYDSQLPVKHPAGSLLDGAQPLGAPWPYKVRVKRVRAAEGEPMSEESAYGARP